LAACCDDEDPLQAQQDLSILLSRVGLRDPGSVAAQEFLSLSVIEQVQVRPQLRTLEQLLDWQSHPELTDVDKLVVEYSIAVTSNWHRIRDAMFERLRTHFSEAQIVELTWRIALCGAFNRFNDVLQVEVVGEPSLSGSVPSIGSN
jgi:hypothetical protein